MANLPPIPQPPRWSNGTAREDTTALWWLWGTFVQTLTQTLPNLLRRLAYDIDSHR